MRATVILPFLTLATAVPRPFPQNIDVDDYLSNTITDPGPTDPPVGVLNDTIPFDPSAVVAAAVEGIKLNPLNSDDAQTGYSRLVERRDACTQEPGGVGPKPLVDTVDAFLSYSVFSDAANSASTPDGYTQIFANQQSSISMPGYRGLTTLDVYDTYKCQELCDGKTDGCAGFNLFYERNPTVSPGAACPDPPSFTNIKCTLWNLAPTLEAAANDGQHRTQFHVVIAGSNAYVKKAKPNPVPGYDGPTSLGGAINAPLGSGGVNTYMGYKFFPDVYDPRACGAACTTQTAYNSRHPLECQYKACNMFNAYVLSKNGTPQGMYCSMYNQVWAPDYATNYGQYRGDDRYTVSQSYSFSKTGMGPGVVSMLGCTP